MKKIEGAVLFANVAFQRSGINAMLRTVAVEPDSKKYGISLTMPQANEGVIDPLIWALGRIENDPNTNVTVGPDSPFSLIREEYGADLVYAIVRTDLGTSCGIAHFRNKDLNADLAAKYTASGAIYYHPEEFRGCLNVHSRALTHEVGHNLGLLHQSYDVYGERPEGSWCWDDSNPFVPHGRGYLGKNIDNTTYGTMMAVCRGRFRQPIFSTNAKKYKGLKVESSEANAADALLYTIEDASNYAPTKIKDPEQTYFCTENASSVCLQKGRFKVEARVSYVDQDGNKVNNAKAKVKRAFLNGVSKTAALFYFFGESNPELLIKVINGCGINGKYWVFGSAGTDLDHSVVVTDNATGVKLPYHRNSADPLINDTSAFPCESAALPAAAREPDPAPDRERADQTQDADLDAADEAADAGDETGGEADDEERKPPLPSDAEMQAPPSERTIEVGDKATLTATVVDDDREAVEAEPKAPKDYGCLEDSFSISCLQEGRFKVQTDFKDPERGWRRAIIRQALVGDEAQLFYFFSFDNPELLVKVLDGCGVNGKYWVFASAATDLDYVVRVTDMAREKEVIYERNGSNPLVNEVNDFPCDP